MCKLKTSNFDKRMRYKRTHSNFGKQCRMRRNHSLLNRIYKIYKHKFDYFYVGYSLLK